MKKTKNILVALVLMIAAGLTSCIKENLAETPEDNGTANVNLVLDSRAGEFDENEGIKTLRLLIIDDNGTINFNRQVSPTNLSDNSVSLKLIGLAMGTGTKNFYVIANEKSIGLTAEEFESEYAEKKQLQGEWKQTLKSLPVDERGNHFYKTASDIDTDGLPITGYREDFPIQKDQNNEVDITITYAVSKIKLTFINERTTDQTISNITFRNVEPKGGTTLFGPSLSLPTGISEASLKNSVTVPKLGEASAILYVYENQKPQDNDYSFTATWNNDKRTFLFSEIPFKEEDGSAKRIDDLLRGQELDIEITLLQNTVEDLELRFTVSSWGNKDIEIPSFE